jgi:hypothetical protein
MTEGSLESLRVRAFCQTERFFRRNFLLINPTVIEISAPTDRLDQDAHTLAACPGMAQTIGQRFRIVR